AHTTQVPEEPANVEELPSSHQSAPAIDGKSGPEVQTASPSEKVDRNAVAASAPSPGAEKEMADVSMPDANDVPAAARQAQPPNEPEPEAEHEQKQEQEHGHDEAQAERAKTFELDREIHSTSSPIVTAGPDVSSEPTQSTSAPESTAQQQQQPQTHQTHNIPREERSSGEPSNEPGRSQKRRRQSSSSPLSGARLTGVYRSGQPESKRLRANDTSQATGPKQAEDMRLDTNSSQHEHRARTSANGSSSQNGGSSPHTNGSTKSGDTNGYHTNGHAEPNVSPFYGHDREEVTRILLQSLSDLGYGGAARQLSAESGFELEIPSVAAF
ncbi:hypothetical protein KC317_g17597, partial [Hortaea werneckii]